MVPEGWKETSIKNVCSAIIDCVNKTAPTLDQVTPYRMVRTTNVRDGKLSLKSVKYVSEETYKKWIRRGAPLKNDIILTREAPVGEVALVEEDEGIFLGQRLVMYRTDREKADYKYILHSLLGNYCQKQLEILCNGGTVHHVRVPECETIKILLPPLPEQKKIARILSTWDKAIETVDKLIENSKQQKKALMQQLLTGKKRLPGFSGEWKEVRLNDLFKPVTRKNTKNISLVLTVSGENGLVDQTTYFNRKVAADCLDGYYHLKKGEFAYNRSAMKGYPFGAIKRLEQHENGVLSTLYMCFKLKSTTNSGDFYSHYFEHGLANKELYKVVQIGARAHGLLNISKGDFFDIKILCPPEDEQKAIANVLNTMDTLLNKEKRQRKALLCQKQALMQQLLTGKSRVTIEE